MFTEEVTFYNINIKVNEIYEGNILPGQKDGVIGYCTVQLTVQQIRVYRFHLPLVRSLI
jgi:hypothetical protein